MKMARTCSLLTTLCTILACSGPSLSAQQPSQMGGYDQRMLFHPQERDSHLASGLQCHYNDAQYLYRIHPDAYYHPVEVSASGDNIRLHDASLWYVHPYQRHLVRQWVQSDPIFIKPNTSCFSMYRYVLQNRETQDVVEVNFKESPIYTGAAVFWIVDINYGSHLIRLNDGTEWQISPYEGSFNKWRINDRLIVGVNNEWRYANYPHILINITMPTTPYCQADIHY